MPITRTAVLAVVVVALVLLSWMEAASGKSLNHAMDNARKLGSKRNATIRDFSLSGRQHFSALPQNLRMNFWELLNPLIETDSYKDKHFFDKRMEKLREKHEEEEGEFADEGETCARDQEGKEASWLILKPCYRWLDYSNRHCRQNQAGSKDKVCLMKERRGYDGPIPEAWTTCDKKKCPGGLVSL